MLLISNHARCRYTERFPYAPLTIEDALAATVPFGGQKTTTEQLLLNVEHKIVFAVIYDGATHDRIVKTVLTLDQAYASLAQGASGKAWRKQSVAPAEPVLEKKADGHAMAKLAYTAETVQELQKLAAQDVVKWEYIYPPVKEVRSISREIRDTWGYPLRAIETHYWKEVGKLIYEHNTKHRFVVKDVEQIKTG
jgi:hypothetical protein